MEITAEALTALVRDAWREGYGVGWEDRDRDLDYDEAEEWKYSNAYKRLADTLKCGEAPSDSGAAGGEERD